MRHKVSLENFPDRVFRSYLQGYWKECDKDGDGKLSDEELHSLTIFATNVNQDDDSSPKIKSLQGIEKLKYLKEVKVYGNSIRGVLDVSGLSDLTSLRCGGNKITSIVLPEESRLKELECSLDPINIEFSLRVGDSGWRNPYPPASGEGLYPPEYEEDQKMYYASPLIKKLGDITLMEGWQWEERTDTAKKIEAGKLTTAAAIYTAQDAYYYDASNLNVEISIVKIVAIVTHSRMILAAFYPKRRQSFQSFIWLMMWKAPKAGLMASAIVSRRFGAERLRAIRR